MKDRLFKISGCSLISFTNLLYKLSLITFRMTLVLNRIRTFTHGRLRLLNGQHRVVLLLYRVVLFSSALYAVIRVLVSTRRGAPDVLEDANGIERVA